MAILDLGARPRDSLPSINQLHFEKSGHDFHEKSRYHSMDGLSSTAASLTSPTSLHSGPPPPYSCPPSATGSVTGLSGYISPPESTTRRSTRDEKESPGSRKSLPSIHEALGAPLSTPSQQQSISNPPPIVGQSFPDAPPGPINPFSQPSGPAPVLRDVFSSTHKSSSTSADQKHANPPYSPTTVPDPRQLGSQHFGYQGSPRAQAAPSFRSSSSLANTSFSNQNDHHSVRSPQNYEGPRHSFSYSQFGNSAPNFPTPSQEPFHFSAGSKPDDQRVSHSRPAHDSNYGDTVKRHLDVFDAELGLNEIVEASARTSDFSRLWAQRYHSNSRSGYYQDALPSLHEIDDMLRHSHCIFQNLTHLREVVVAQQTALSEQRARLARGGQLEDDYHNLPDEYKLAAGDAKKRRGKAAPPGRCHSCNRAETPEWRRGPDGARTLCNACGLHYAKLTRKMGVNKATAMTGSNLRPKSLDSTRL